MSITARSEHSETPSTLALSSFDSPPTHTLISAAPATTWLLVTAMPDGSMMKPLPRPAELNTEPTCGSTKDPSASIWIVALLTPSSEETAPPGETAPPEEGASVAPGSDVPPPPAEQARLATNRV